MDTAMTALETTQVIAWSKTIPGKWILFGEHAVLRGGKAIVFPLMAQHLNLNYLKNDAVFKVQLVEVKSAELEQVIQSTIGRVLAMCDVRREQLTGTLVIDAHIEFGAGMGASATLAVGFTEFLIYLGYVKTNDAYTFAKKIEDIFHGESSGVDVAVTLNQKALIFEQTKENHFLQNVKLPKLYLSYSGVRGVTKDCVFQVKKLFETDPKLATAIDQDMKSCSDDFIAKHNSWTMKDWIFNIEKAQSCFDRWKLVPDAVKKHRDFLTEHGAKASKLTGSGGGGYVLSLWEHEPPLTIINYLIPLFEKV